MRLSVKTNVDEVFDKLEAAFGIVQTVALPRAANELIEQAQTAGNREAARIYRLPVRELTKYASVKLARSGDLEASITVKGKGFPVYLFQPRQTRAGVTVSIKGRRILIPGAFIATMRNGHVGVFARGAYGAKGGRRLKPTGSFGRFTFGRGERVERANKWGSSELPINELYTFGPVESFSNPDVTAAMQDRVEARSAKVIERNIRFARGG